MADIQFDEPTYAPPAREEQVSYLSRLVIKTGLAKDGTGAQRVLLIVLVLVIFATIFVWWHGSSPTLPNSAPVIH